MAVEVRRLPPRRRLLLEDVKGDIEMTDDPLAVVEAEDAAFDRYGECENCGKSRANHHRLLPEPAVRAVMVEWFREEAKDARDHESTSSDARTYDRLADRLENKK